MTRVNAFFLNLILVICSILTIFILIEFFIRFIVFDTPYKFNFNQFVSDDILLYKMIPGGEIDINGFRNVSVLDKYDIITIGDSQTFGINAPFDKTWPSQLSSFMHLRVYNMSLCGYGPVQYYYLSKKAINFRPSVVIWGIYLGNDMLDAYYLPYERDITKHWNYLKDPILDNKFKKLKRSFVEELEDKVAKQIDNNNQNKDDVILLKLRNNLRKFSKLYSFLGDRTRFIKEKIGISKKQELKFNNSNILLIILINISEQL